MVRYLFTCCSSSSKCAIGNFFQVITEQIRHADGDFLNLGDIMVISERLYNIQGIVEEMMIDLKLKHLIPHFLFVELNLIVFAEGCSTRR